MKGETIFPGAPYLQVDFPPNFLIPPSLDSSVGSSRVFPALYPTRSSQEWVVDVLRFSMPFQYLRLFGRRDSAAKRDGPKAKIESARATSRHPRAR